MRLLIRKMALNGQDQYLVQLGANIDEVRVLRSLVVGQILAERVGGKEDDFATLKNLSPVLEEALKVITYAEKQRSLGRLNVAPQIKIGAK